MCNYRYIYLLIDVLIITDNKSLDNVYLQIHLLCTSLYKINKIIQLYKQYKFIVQACLVINA